MTSRSVKELVKEEIERLEWSWKYNLECAHNLTRIDRTNESYYYKGQADALSVVIERIKELESKI